MPELLQIFKCDVCGNITELVHGGEGELVCCGQPMKELEEHTVDEGKEKHVPVIEKVDGGFKVKIGSTPHPMEEKHYIEWVEIVHYPNVYRHFFKPGDSPEATFKIEGAGEVLAREYCNIHGLWKG